MREKYNKNPISIEMGVLISKLNEDRFSRIPTFYHLAKQQIKSSKTLNQTGIKDQNLFFNKAIRKIDYYIDQLNNQIDLMF